MAYGFAVSFAVLFLAIVLATSYRVHRRVELVLLGSVLALGLIPIGTWTGIAIRRSLHREWQEPDPITLRRLGIGMTAVGILVPTLAAAVQPLFGNQPWQWSLLWLAIGGVSLAVWTTLIGPRVFRTPTGEPLYSFKLYKEGATDILRHLASDARDNGWEVEERPPGGNQSSSVAILFAGDSTSESERLSRPSPIL